MSKKPPYYQMHPADFDGDENVRRLDMHQAGFFLFCLNHGWQNGGSIPSDEHELARIFKLRPSVFARLWKLVSRCFVPHPTDVSRLVNPRQWKEYCALMHRSETSSRCGKLGAEARWSDGDRHEGAMRSPSHARSGSESGSVSPETVEAQQCADAPVVETPPPSISSVRDYRDFEEIDQALKQRWKKTGPDQITTQELSAAVHEGEDLYHIRDGLLAWCDWYDEQPDGWRYCHERLVDAIRAKKWRIFPPHPNSQKLTTTQRAIVIAMERDPETKARLVAGMREAASA